MQKFALLIFTLLLTSTGILQAQTYDVAMGTLFSPANNDTISNNIEVIRFSYTNNGDTLKGANGDTVRFVMYVDGTRYLTLTRDMSTDFNAGATDTVSALSVFSNIAPGVHNFCIVSTLVGQSDNNANNDTICSSTTVEAFDLSVQSFAIDTPALNPGDSVEIGTAINAISLTVRNNGNVTFLGQFDFNSQSLILPFSITVDGATSNLRITSTQQNPINIGPGQTTTIRGSIRSLGLTAPTTVKNFDICMATELAIDGDSTNDSSCETYKTFEQATQPNSVSELNNDGNWNILSANQTLTLTGMAQGHQDLEMRVLSMTGAQIMSQNMNVEGEVNEVVSFHAPAGIYLVQVSNSNEVVHAQRVYVK
ncbi:hypothetical protein KFE98_00205 [bacterium SCSIO 12741]|nr:hypothetical protein KFE98_00205 [bacterium SCSIO 12741]